MRVIPQLSVLPRSQVNESMGFQSLIGLSEGKFNCCSSLRRPVYAEAHIKTTRYCLNRRKRLNLGLLRLDLKMPSAALSCRIPALNQAHLTPLSGVEDV